MSDANFTPNLKPTNKLTPFKFFMLQNFPYIAEDFDSITTYELMCKLAEYMNNVITNVNEQEENISNLYNAYNELQNYINNYFKNLNVQNEINNKLDEMTKDGTLANIINNEIFSNLNKKINNKISSFLNYNRIGRIVDETFLVNKNANGYYGMQGGAMIDDTTIAFISNHYAIEGFADENSLIRKVSLVTGNVLSEKVVEIGHGNGFVYDKNEHVFYVASSHGNVNNETYENKIIKLDDDFNIVNTIITSLTFDSLSFDESGNLYAGITYKKSSDSNKIFKVNKDTFEILETINLQMPVENNIGTGQDFCIYNNNIFYLQYNPNQIFVFDMNGKNIKNYEFLNNNFYNIGEPENINSLGDGNFIIGSSLQYSGNLYNYEQFFEINIIRNVAIKNQILNNNYQFRHNFTNIFVDNSKNVFNPDGSEEKPFYSIEEIVNADYDLQNSITIYLVGNKNYPIARINNFNGQFMGSEANIVSGDGYNNIMLRNSHIYFNNIKQIYPLNLDINDDVKLYNCTISSTTYEQLINIMSNSKCELENCKFNVTKELENALFNNVHGILLWNKNNQNLTNLPEIKKWFNGTVDLLVPINLYNGNINKNENIVLNNNNLDGIFKELSLRFTDFGEFIIPCRNGNYNFITANLSKSGTGNNNFYAGVIKVDNGTITVTAINQITFNSSGEMTVNINPTYSLYNIYAY